jgi:hypothetical protein
VPFLGHFMPILVLINFLEMSVFIMSFKAFVFPHYHFVNITKMAVNTASQPNSKRIPTGSLLGNNGNALFTGIPP